MGYGDAPHIKRGFQVDPKRLFFKGENGCLKKVVTIVPGYGILEAGTLLGQITESASRLSQFVPYAIAAPTKALPFIAGAYVLEDGGQTDTTIKVTMPDSYKFAVGDHLAAVDSDATPIDLGAISAIDRTTYTHYAVITVAEVDLRGITVANGGMIFIQTQTGTPWTNAIGILVEGVDTGEGADAVGAQGTIVISNAMLYKGLLPNYDAGALTDLSGIISGQYLVLK
jgi:hypothetical protein